MNALGLTEAQIAEVAEIFKLDLTMQGFYEVVGRTERGRKTYYFCRCKVCGQQIRSNHEGPLRVHGRTHPDQWNEEKHTVDRTFGGRYRIIQATHPMKLECARCGLVSTGYNRKALMVHLQSKKCLEADFAHGIDQKPNVSPAQAVKSSPIATKTEDGNLNNSEGISLSGSFDPRLTEFFVPAFEHKKAKNRSRMWSVKCIFCKKDYNINGNAHIRLHVSANYCITAQKALGEDERVKATVDQTRRPPAATSSVPESKPRAHLHRIAKSAPNISQPQEVAENGDEEIGIALPSGSRSDTASDTAEQTRTFVGPTDWTVGDNFRILRTELRGRKYHIVRCLHCDYVGMEANRSRIVDHLCDEHPAIFAQIQFTSQQPVDWTFGGRYLEIRKVRIANGFRRTLECIPCGKSYTANYKEPFQKHLREAHGMNSAGLIEPKCEPDDEPMDAPKPPVTAKHRAYRMQTAVKSSGPYRVWKTLPEKTPPIRKNGELVDWTLNGNFRLIRLGPMKIRGRSRKMECAHCGRTVVGCYRPLFAKHLKKCNDAAFAALPPHGCPSDVAEVRMPIRRRPPRSPASAPVNTKNYPGLDSLFRPLPPSFPKFNPADHTLSAVERWMATHGLGGSPLPRAPRLDSSSDGDSETESSVELSLGETHSNETGASVLERSLKFEIPTVDGTSYLNATSEVTFIDWENGPLRKPANSSP